MSVGIDPHFSFANMLCDVAWARAHGTASFILPQVGDVASEANAKALRDLEAPGLPAHIVELMRPRPAGNVCGRCNNYPMGPDGPPAQAECPLWKAFVLVGDPSCEAFEPVDDGT